MNDNALSDRGRLTAKVASPLLIVALIVVVVVWDPLGSLVRALDLGSIPLPDLPNLPNLPDLPGWLAFLAGPGKMIVIVLIVVLVGAGEAQRRRSEDAKDGSGA